MQNDNDSNAGAATPGTGDSIGSGSPQGTPSGTSTSDNQNGTQTDPRDEKITTLTNDVKALNKALVEAKRGGKTNGQGNPQDGQNPFETPEGQYGIAIQLATGNLRGKMEDVFSLYPELPADEIARIRKNPWAFASHESFVNGDWEAAALEIEQAMLDRAEEINAQKTNNANNPNPANVNANPAQDEGEEPTVVPGSPEDENEWTMPMDKLEAKKNKAVAKVSQSK